VATDLNARRGMDEHSRELVLAFLDRDTDQTTPGKLKEIEGIKVRIVFDAAAMSEQVENSQALLIADHDFSVDQPPRT
jgi:hypothetical protein